MEKKIILITGVAGFIGYHLCSKLLSHLNNVRIIGIDNLNDYYDIGLKNNRLSEIDKIKHDNQYIFINGDISDIDFVEGIITDYAPDYVINLAAQAGVRNCAIDPDSYVRNNINGFYNILECCRFCDNIKHIIFASSSSVYGNNKKYPFSEDDVTDKPESLYAATKKSNELMAYSYTKMFGLKTTGLRFFTVYGPYGRPDMFYYSFLEDLINGKEIIVPENDENR